MNTRALVHIQEAPAQGGGGGGSEAEQGSKGLGVPTSSPTQRLQGSRHLRQAAPQLPEPSTSQQAAGPHACGMRCTQRGPHGPLADTRPGVLHDHRSMRKARPSSSSFAACTRVSAARAAPLRMRWARAAARGGSRWCVHAWLSAHWTWNTGWRAPVMKGRLLLKARPQQVLPTQTAQQVLLGVGRARLGRCGWPSCTGHAARDAGGRVRDSPTAMGSWPYPPMQ